MNAHLEPIPEATSENYWDVADRWRRAYAQRLIEHRGRLEDLRSFVWYVLRYLFVSVFVVAPGSLFSIAAVALVSTDDLSRIVRDLHEQIAATPVRDPLMYQDSIRVLGQIWGISALFTSGLLIALNPWRSPMDERIESFMDRWHVEHSHLREPGPEHSSNA